MYSKDVFFEHAFVLPDETNLAKTYVHFSLNGKPKPLDRARLGTTKFYDPNRKEKDSFRQQLKRIMAECMVVEMPIYKKRIKLEVEVVFYLATTAGRSPDVDNLAKFVLVGLAGVVTRLKPVEMGEMG